MDRSSRRRPTRSSPGLNPLSALFFSLLGSDDESQVERAIDEFQATADAYPFLLNKLSGGSSDERWWAVRLLAELDHPDAPAALQMALSDPERMVRQCAALGLRKRPDPLAIPGLVQSLNSEDRLESRLAGDALIRHGSEAVPYLLDALKEGSQPTRVEAIRALALMDDLEAVPALFAALDDESAVIEHWADEGLQRRGIGMIFY